MSAIEAHAAKQWPGSKATIEHWTKGPIAQVMPDFRILVLAPSVAGKPWVYITAGASDISVGGNYGLEFFLFSKSFERQHVELLSLVTYMHRDSHHHLSVGHTMNLGRPWEERSECDRLLVSLPYILGPNFEYLHVAEMKHIRFLWIIPITPEEESYRHHKGLEALEAAFEEASLQYVDPRRNSVVA